MLWPDHCVQGTAGAEIHSGLGLDHVELITAQRFSQRRRFLFPFRENDRISRTGLTGYLRERGLGRIFLAGLAYDYCVRYSAIDSMQAGFRNVCGRRCLPSDRQESFPGGYATRLQGSRDQTNPQRHAGSSRRLRRIARMIG